MGESDCSRQFRSLVARCSGGEWRRDHRIPFLLKLAGQQEELDYHSLFNSVLTRELLLKLLRVNEKAF